MSILLLHLLFLSFTLRPLSSTHHRRILHQPFLPLESSPPPTPSPPSPPKYPFTTTSPSTPDNSPFFPSYTSPPAPPSPASLATFPANISSLSVPRPSKPNSASSKLIVAAVAAVIAAVAVVSLAVFLHLRRRSARSSSSVNESKTQGSDSCSTVSINPGPNTRHIPKLQRPSQSSAEFLYLGTLVNSHAPGAAFNGSGTSSIYYNNSRKLESPELRPLPPLLIQQQSNNAAAEVVSSKDDESEKFYSPKGSITGSIGTGSASRRTFATIEVENFDGSISDSSCTYASSVPGSGSGSPAINSIPKSPDLIEIPTVLPLPELGDSLLQESASPSPPSSSSPDRYSRRSEESSPRVSNASDQNVESPIPNLATMIGDLVLPENKSEESSPRNSNVFLDQYVASPLKFSSPIQDSLSPERKCEESDSDVSDKKTESPLRNSSIQDLPLSSSSSSSSSPRDSDVLDQKTESPLRNNSHIQDLPLSSSSSPERKCEESSSSPRDCDVSDRKTESPVQNRSHIQDLPLSSSLSPERKCEESSSPRNSNVSDQNTAESSMRISSPSPDVSTALEMQRFTQECAEIIARVVLVEEPSTNMQQALLLPEPASQSPPNLTSENSSDVESPVRPPSHDHHNSNDIPPTASEFAPLWEKEELSPRVSDDHNTPLEMMKDSGEKEMLLSPTISNASDDQNTNVITSTPLEMSPERYSQTSEEEESSPRISNASDQICSSEDHNSPSQISCSMPETHSREIEEPSSSMILNDFQQSVESPVENGGSIQQNATVTLPSPPPPPPPPAFFPVFVPSMQSPVSIIPPPPPPPPPPLIKAWDSSPKTPTPPPKNLMGPPPLQNPLKPIAFETSTLISPLQLPSNDSQTVKNDGDKESPNKETDYLCENVDSPPKPKLKPLHWDKVRASSDREMVWDQLKCSSTFELNEEMIETLFVVNTPKPNPKEATRWQVLPSPGQDNGDRVLDPKKAQNIAILLKALHVTVDEVCEGLLEGNADILGTDLLESLLKMAPTKDEERKLKEYKDDSPVKLGPAERFLKAVVNIPYAFRRVETMLYISNFESEVDYLKNSFSTLEAACEELRTSRMFLKLLEAVLKTGNRMNVGTNRGDAHAFKLDTLLKLVDVKGADGKTTLLHFVVQEIIRSEGARLSAGGGPQTDDSKCRKLGLEVVSAISCELSNVKKAAAMDAEMLSSDVSKLSKGIGDVREVVKINEDIVSLKDSKFSESINSFIEKGEEEIFRIQAQERLAMSLVKEITEYFHGNSALEEAHPFRIFMVVRDFLTSLDRVCKEVGMINERTIVSSAYKFPVPINPMLQQVSGSDDENV